MLGKEPNHGIPESRIDGMMRYNSAAHKQELCLRLLHRFLQEKGLQANGEDVVYTPMALGGISLGRGSQGTSSLPRGSEEFLGIPKVPPSS